MKAFTLTLGLAALAKSQSFDWASIDAVPTPSKVVVPIGAGSTTVPYDSNAAVFSAGAEVTASPLSQSVTTALAPGPKRRGRAAVIERDECSPQPLGSGPTPQPDTAEAFLADSSFFSTAENAQAPSGFKRSFKNLQGSNSAYAYMGYTSLDSYSADECASKCEAIHGCNAFNIFFERDPSLDPGVSCPDPPSTTVIKCVFWGGPVYDTNADNNGQWRRDFHVVIAGSNGYNTESFDAPDGYTSTTLGQVAINEPSGCSTYMGVKTFSSGPFDPALCAEACSAQSEYNRAHPDSGGNYQTCQFYNTYMLIQNGGSGVQICSLYSASWDQSYATNDGQWRGDDHYTVDFSVTGSNSTDPGSATCST
ncbi:uncharacterized protein JN550_012638 [Neoarthrinium moseri]|uniref:uncharacterized protein n=1 Tax=Neoarthrinium moseri TaxID=1658444 RepID=UPI001FDDB162|nr:uncharacterized protein JN550_012638 [Neoarthrinium moseri]KAI1858428.1 hypothetical protein JN550_012638 [Neoarthrinium moseri]